LARIASFRAACSRSRIVIAGVHSLASRKLVSYRAGVTAATAATFGKILF
jgi:hypothetical protein